MSSWDVCGAVCAGCCVGVFVVELTRFGAAAVLTRFAAAVLTIGGTGAVDLAAVLAVPSSSSCERGFSVSMTYK